MSDTIYIYGQFEASYSGPFSKMYGRDGLRSLHAIELHPKGCAIDVVQIPGYDAAEASPHLDIWRGKLSEVDVYFAPGQSQRDAVETLHNVWLTNVQLTYNGKRFGMTFGTLRAELRGTLHTNVKIAPVPVPPWQESPRPVASIISSEPPILKKEEEVVLGSDSAGRSMGISTLSGRAGGRFGSLAGLAILFFLLLLMAKGCTSCGVEEQRYARRDESTPAPPRPPDTLKLLPQNAHISVSEWSAVDGDVISIRLDGKALFDSMKLDTIPFVAQIPSLLAGTHQLEILTLDNGSMGAAASPHIEIYQGSMVSRFSPRVPLDSPALLNIYISE